jgi:hypothetical protein
MSTTEDVRGYLGRLLGWPNTNGIHSVATRSRLNALYSDEY